MPRDTHSETLLRPARRSDRLSPFLLVYVLLSLLVLLGAMSTQNNMLFWLVGVAISSIIVSGFIAGPAMMGVRLGPMAPQRFADAGTATALAVRIVNVNRRRSLYALRITAEWSGPGGRVVSVRAGCAAVRAGRHADVPLEVVFPSRGAWRVRTVQIETTFPFGLSRKLLIFRPAGRVLCLPAAASVTRFSGRSPGMVQRTVSRAMPASNDGELVGLREYRPGDPKRRIAWRATARLGRLCVREHEPSNASTFWICPDVSLAALRDKTESAERTMAYVRGVAEQLERRAGRVGVWHPASGAASRPGDTASWRRLVAELGEQAPRESAGPGPGTSGIVVGPEGVR
ncbi:MAG: DUF58 domain-containing protein [Planctomycetota bacterium]